MYRARPWLAKHGGHAGVSRRAGGGVLLIPRWAIVCALSLLVLWGFMGRGDGSSSLSNWPGSPFGAVPGSASEPQVIQAEARPGVLAGESVPLAVQGDVGFNIQSALNANQGALWQVRIAPGETWSFNASVGNPEGVPIRTVGGVPGGGWCDLAARYVQAVRPVLRPEDVQFINHVTTAGIWLPDVAFEDQVSIWNLDGQPGNHGGRQDLLITNSRAETLYLYVSESAPGSMVVRAMLVAAVP